MSWEEDRALRLAVEIEHAGWDLFQALRTVRLTEAEAERLYLALQYLTQALPAFRQGLQREGQSNGD